MAIIAITGRKGGIGKSTITANLAAELVALGRSVVVLDTDPQKSLMAWAELGEGLLCELLEAVDTTTSNCSLSQPCRTTLVQLLTGLR